MLTMGFSCTFPKVSAKGHYHRLLVQYAYTLEAYSLIPETLKVTDMVFVLQQNHLSFALQKMSFTHLDLSSKSLTVRDVITQLSHKYQTLKLSYQSPKWTLFMHFRYEQ